MNNKIIVSSIMILGLAFNLQAQDLFSTVKVDTLVAAKQTATSPAQLLRGQVSGVRVSGTDGSAEEVTLTNIRGLNALRSNSSQPLWIVDGAIVNDSQFCNSEMFSQYSGAPSTTPLNEFFFLSPYQIGSITVLKDASQTAMYGARGANGVIIVNTRKSCGRELNVELHSNLILNTPFSANDGKLAFSNNHTLFLEQTLDKINYSIGGFYRNSKSSTGGSGGDHGGFRAQFSTLSSSLVHFGFNTVFAFGTTLGNISDYRDENSAKQYRSISSVFLDFNFLPWLKWKNRGGVDYSDNTHYMWFDNGSPFGLVSNGAAAINYSKQLNANLESRLCASGFVAPDHKIGGELGVNLNYNMNNCNLQCDTGFVDHSLGARGIELANGQDIPRKTGLTAFQLEFVGGVNYSFKDIVAVEGFLNASNTKYFDGPSYTFYPSGNASINLHNAFFRNFKAVSNVTLKGGWGRSGREYYVPTQDWGDFTSVDYGTVKRSEMVYFDALNRLCTTEWNAGIDLGFISNRLLIGVKYYNRNTDDVFTMYNNGNKDEVTGVTSQGDRKVLGNSVCSVNNNGVEADLSADIVHSGNWRFGLTASFAYNLNLLTDVNSDEQSGRTVYGIVPNSEVKGQSVSVFTGYDVDPVSGAYVDHTGDGVITEADKLVLGNSLPKYNGGLGLNLSWKTLRMEAMFDGCGDFKILDMDAMFSNKATEISSTYVKNGDYLRFRSLTIGYDFLFKKGSWIRSIGIDLSCHNIFTLSEYGRNPDVNTFGFNARSYGVDYGSCALSRKLVLGLSFKF